MNIFKSSKYEEKARNDLWLGVYLQQHYKDRYLSLSQGKSNLKKNWEFLTTCLMIISNFLL